MLHRVGLLALLLAAPVALGATVIVPAEFREVVNGADIIAYGRVIETAPEAGRDRRQVNTLVTFQVGTYLKGGPGETIVFRVPGGQIGRYRTVLVGAPMFAPGEEAVVFLKASAGERPVVFGLNQGVYRVRLDSRTNRRLVQPPPLMARGDTPQRIVRGSRAPVALETFGAQVQSVIDGTAVVANAAGRAR